MIKEAIAKVVRGEHLTEVEMEQMMEEIMTGTAHLPRSVHSLQPSG